ncbi:MAG: hypothetical protein KDA71_09300, partial [Planctomycetales bacterium]|nr:hypothetical protein [Planctomycetales bacterium]
MIVAIAEVDDHAANGGRDELAGLIRKKINVNLDVPVASRTHIRMVIALSAHDEQRTILQSD